MNFNNSMSIGLPTYTIYKITVLNKVYIGKTSNFERRRSEHIRKHRDKNSRDYNMPVYKYIREMEEKGEFKFDKSHFEIIEVIEDYEDEEYILHIEKAWIEFYRDELKIDMLNDRRPIINEEERKEYNKEKKKIYREENKDEILEKAKKYREANRDKINRKAKEKAKEKRENETPRRREERLKKMKEYNAKHRAKRN